MCDTFKVMLIRAGREGNWSMTAHLRWRDQVQSEETQGEFDCDLGIWCKNIWPLNSYL